MVSGPISLNVAAYAAEIFNGIGGAVPPKVEANKETLPAPAKPAPARTGTAALLGAQWWGVSGTLASRLNNHRGEESVNSRPLTQVFRPFVGVQTPRALHPVDAFFGVVDAPIRTYNQVTYGTLATVLPAACGSTDSEEINYAPDISYIEPQEVKVGETLTVNISDYVSDEEGDSLTYSFINVEAPDGATIDSFSGLFQWAPTEDQVGSRLINIAVSDEEHTSVIVLHVTVLPNEEEKPDPEPCVTLVDGMVCYVTQDMDICPGTYKVSLQLVNVDGIKIQGHGEVKLLGAPSGNIGDGDGIITLINSHHVTVSGINVKGGGYSIVLKTSSDNTIKDIVIEDTGCGFGVTTYDDCNRNTISALQVHDGPGPGVLLEGSDNVVQNSTFILSDLDLYCDIVTGPTILGKHSIVKNNTFEGIKMNLMGVGQALVEGNTIVGPRYEGIWLNGVKDTIIHGNTIEDAEVAIKGYCTGCEIYGNTLGGASIEVEGSGNHVYNNPAY